LFQFVQETAMLRLALGFLIVALVAALFGFTGIASGAATIARFLCFLFVTAFALCAIFGYRHRRLVVVDVRRPRK
jgi:uncharacterized membrane protein YtjA (UPF0391 family)